MATETKERRFSLPPLVCKLQTRPMMRKGSQQSQGLQPPLGERKNSMSRAPPSRQDANKAGGNDASLRRRVSNASHRSAADSRMAGAKMPVGAAAVRGTGVPLESRKRLSIIAQQGRGNDEEPAATGNGQNMAVKKNYGAGGASDSQNAPRRKISQIDQISVGSSDMQRRITTLEQSMAEEISKLEVHDTLQGWMSPQRQEQAEQSVVSSVEPATPEPGFALYYGRNLEKFNPKKHPGYKPKRCWCNRCQMMFRLHVEGNSSALKHWGNYPCHQF